MSATKEHNHDEIERGQRDAAYLNGCIKKATPRLSKIKDVDKHLDEIRGVVDLRSELIAFDRFMSIHDFEDGIPSPEQAVDEFLKSRETMMDLNDINEAR